MRVGKKKTVVEAKKTRSCVVRLEKVPTPTTRRIVSRVTVGGGYKASPAQDEKKFKGPLKKRPISSQASTPVATPKAKEKIKAKPTPPPAPPPQQQQLQQQQRKVTKAPIARVAEKVETPPPTIAAGRSRRAIKPNPKYASEDIVTPKSIKSIGTPTTGSGNKKVAVGVKSRKYSSSSEDFFNKDSSDDLSDDIELDEYVAGDKAYNETDSKDSDSDFDELVEEVSRSTRKRAGGRPKKIVSAVSPLEKPRTQLATPAPASKTTPIVRSSQSQLQQLRKTLSASVSRFAPTSAAATTTDSADRKRKAESSQASDDEHFIARKRFMQGPVAAKNKVVGGIESKVLQLNSKTIISRNNLSSQTLNGSKIVKTPVSEKKPGPAVLDKVAGGKFNAKPTSVARPSQNPIMLNKAAATKGIASAKQRSSSPASSKGAPSAASVAAAVAAAKEAKIAAKEQTKKLENTLNLSAGDDFETMPTFTIVNINDIINKKGDVLISKAEKNAAVQGKAAGKSESPKAVTAADRSSPPPPDSSPETKANRRKAGHTTILSEKIDPERFKNPGPRTPLPAKKATQTTLNHTQSKKTPATSQRTTRASNMSNSAEKPAPPRILNSMVAKKTQPVKPMIANPDDSGDESFPLSLDGDEEDMDGDEEDEDEEEESSFVVSGKRKLPSSTPFAYSKSTAPATKENSLAATNRMPVTKQTAAAQRKLSPEKVVISRQGDKIIKKITCFETWYVINVPEERPAKVVRNQLDIPLIKLANMSQQIDLPSSSWSSKVTLFQLSATTVAKSTLITYTGDLSSHNIAEADRSKFQPSCVMFRRAVSDRLKSRLPYDRAVIFKNKTFFTNIEGKNVKLVGAPTTIDTQEEVEILLQVVDGLTLESSFVETATTVQ